MGEKKAREYTQEAAIKYWSALQQVSWNTLRRMDHLLQEKLPVDQHSQCLFNCWMNDFLVLPVAKNTIPCDIFLAIVQELSLLRELDKQEWRDETCSHSDSSLNDELTGVSLPLILRYLGENFLRSNANLERTCRHRH